MSREKPSTTVKLSELLARFVLFKKWFRRSDQTVKSDAFIPHPYPDLSVTAHGKLTETELWRIGQDIADNRPATLYGRADVKASTARNQSLYVVPKPTKDNPNHVHINGWPPDKAAQKSIAQQLAAEATYVAHGGE